MIKNIINRKNYVINIIAIIIVFLTLSFSSFISIKKFRFDYEFNKYKEKRIEIINEIKTEKLSINDNNIVELPSQLKKISSGGTMCVYIDSQENNNAFSFYYFRGIMSGSINIVYFDGTEKELNDLLSDNINIEYIIKIENNWFEVFTK